MKSVRRSRTPQFRIPNYEFRIKKGLSSDSPFYVSSVVLILLGVALLGIYLLRNALLGITLLRNSLLRNSLLRITLLRESLLGITLLRIALLRIALLRVALLGVALLGVALLRITLLRITLLRVAIGICCACGAQALTGGDSLLEGSHGEGAFAGSSGAEKVSCGKHDKRQSHEH